MRTRKSPAFQKLQPPPKVVVTLYNSQRTLPISHPELTKIVSAVLSLFSTNCSEVIFHFVGKKRISALHADHFQDSSPTDCITFPIDEPDSNGILGEVFICPQTALAYTQKHGGNPYEETTLYIIHGLLHLLGYEDQTEGGQIEMRKQEKICLDMLKKKKISLKL